MSKRYALWNRTDTIYTHGGAVLTPDQWIKKFGWINAPGAVPVISAGMINGGFSGELSQMKSRCETQGATFDEEFSNQQLLDAIEAWEDERAAAAAAEAAARAAEPTAEERIAAAMEYQNLLSL